jgi:hypothetical protein
MIIRLDTIEDQDLGDASNPQRNHLEEIRELEGYLEEELEKKKAPVKAMKFRGLVNKVICRQREAQVPSIIKILSELKFRQAVLEKGYQRQERNKNPGDTWEEQQKCRIVNILAEFNEQVHDKLKERQFLNHKEYSNVVKYEDL